MLSFLFWVTVVGAFSVAVGYGGGRLLRGTAASTPLAGALAVALWAAFWTVAWFLGDWKYEPPADETALQSFILFAILYVVPPSPVLFIAAFFLSRRVKPGGNQGRMPTESH